MPTTNDEVRDLAGITHEMLPLAEGQLIHHAEYEYVVAIEIIWTICVLRIYRVIGTVEVVSMSIGIVAKKLEALREALLNFDLKGIVVTAGIVAEIVADVA